MNGFIIYLKSGFLSGCIKITVFMMFFLSFTQTSLAFDHSHRGFDQTLKKYVVKSVGQNLLKYGDIKKNPSGLNEYIRQIEAVSLSEYQQWTTSSKMAFLINSYNALTIKLVLSKYPDISSIRDLGWLFITPWKTKFFTLFGEKQSLGYIEHKLLRKHFNDPRIHFAIVCASKGCPSLRREAYIGEKLEKQLDEATKGFIRNKLRNRFNPETNALEISSIFKWFKEDFIKSSGSLKDFIAPVITDDPEERKLILNNEVEIIFLDYDWLLNKAE